MRFLVAIDIQISMALRRSKRSYGQARVRNSHTERFLHLRGGSVRFGYLTFHEESQMLASVFQRSGRRCAEDTTRTRVNIRKISTQ